jgi:branched-chain amino acid transport system permease protein
VRLVEVSPDHANLLAAVHPFLVGVLLIAVLRWRPDGLCTERGAFARLRKRGQVPPPTPAATLRSAPKQPELQGDKV